MAVKLLWDNQSVMARFEDTGASAAGCRRRSWASSAPPPAPRGLARDVRFDQSSGIYRFAQIPVSTCESGDVFARAFVRWLEIQQSARLHQRAARTPCPRATGGRSARAASRPTASPSPSPRAGGARSATSAITDGRGPFARYKIVDPSFHNWPALAYAMRGQEISDFPLCNKSFNLSYCGHDL